MEAVRVNHEAEVMQDQGQCELCNVEMVGIQSLRSMYRW